MYQMITHVFPLSTMFHFEKKTTLTWSPSHSPRPRKRLFFAHPSLAPLYGDGVIEGRSDELSMLLGPAHLGYVCAGHRGPRSGRGEEACLSIRGALEGVAAAVTVGGLGVRCVCLSHCVGRCVISHCMDIAGWQLART